MVEPKDLSPDCPPVTAVIADANVVLRRGLRSLLEASGQAKVVAEAAGGCEAVRAGEAYRPDVVLLDARLQEYDASLPIQRLVDVTRVLMVSTIDDPAVICRCLRAGATGYLIHQQFTPDELVRAVIGTAAGQPHLSPTATVAVVESMRGGVVRQPAAAASHALSRREREIIEQIVRGHGNGEIAALLFISEKTVKNHINHIYAKLGARHRAEAIARWLGLDGPARPAGAGSADGSTEAANAGPSAYRSRLSRTTTAHIPTVSRIGGAALIASTATR